MKRRPVAQPAHINVIMMIIIIDDKFFQNFGWKTFNKGPLGKDGRVRQHLHTYNVSYLLYYGMLFMTAWVKRD